jgi:hypothetical protein
MTLPEKLYALEMRERQGNPEMRDLPIEKSCQVSEALYEDIMVEQAMRRSAVREAQE